MIREVEPPNPSLRLAETATLADIATVRRTEPSKLVTQVRGELDWIVTKCLEKDRGRRYGTADGLARDLERHLRDEPVSAGPPSARYRFRKFARRHWRALTAALAFTLLLVTGIVTLAIAFVAVNRERHDKEIALQAESKRRKQAREALETLTSQVVEDLFAKQPVLSARQKRFLETALRKYEEFAEDTGQDQESRAWLAQAAFRVGFIHFRLDKGTEAAAAWGRSRDLFAELVADFPGVPAYRSSLARIEYHLGFYFLEAGRLAESKAALGRCLTHSRELIAAFPADPAGPQFAARALNRLANEDLNDGRVGEAESALGEVLALLTPLNTAPNAVFDNRSELASAHVTLGRLRAQTGDAGAALASYETGAAIISRLVADVPADPDYRDAFVRIHNSLGVTHRAARRFPEAMEAFDKAVAVGQPLVAEFPAVPRYWVGLGMALNNLGILHKNEGRAKEAEAAYREALAVNKRLAADFPTVPDYQNEAAGAMVNLARLLLAGDDSDGARRLLEDAVPYHQAALKANPQSAAYRHYYRNNRWRLTETHLALNDHAAAAKSADEFLRAASDPPRDAYTAARLFANCVRLATQDKRLPEGKRQEVANAYADQAIAALRQAVAKGAKEVAQMSTGTNLDPLRRRADFQTLLAESAKRR
jgi:tetratricopeptide (TPR) repeat protein